MRLPALLALVVAGCGGKKSAGSCDEVAGRAVELMAKHDGSSRPEVDQLLRDAVIADCKKQRFDADDFACAKQAADIRALSECRLHGLAELLPPELTCPAGTTVGKPVDAGRLIELACEKDGKKHGPAIRYDHENELVADVTYADGVLDGTFKSMVIDMKVEGTFAAGKQTGPWTVASDDIHLSVDFRGGVPDGGYALKSSNENVLGAYVAGKRSGEWSYRWATETEKAHGSYKDDQRTGTWKFFHAPEDTIKGVPVDAGAARELVAAEGLYRDGVKQPGWKYFDEAGKPLAEAKALETEWLHELIDDDGSDEKEMLAIIQAIK